MIIKERTVDKLFILSYALIFIEKQEIPLAIRYLANGISICIFIPLLFFGWIGWRIDCRSLSYCSLNHWLRGIRFAVKFSRLSLSRRICKGVLSVASHRLCFEENSRPVKFTILPLISSANSIAESPICLAMRFSLRRLAESGYHWELFWWMNWSHTLVDSPMNCSVNCFRFMSKIL